LALHEEDYKLNHKSLGKYDAVKLLSQLKQCDDYAYLNEVDSSALRIAVEDLYTAYDAFFKKKRSHPKVKSRKREHTTSDSTQAINNNIKIKKNAIILPKMGEIKAVIHTYVHGTIKRATFKMTKSGKFFITITSKVDIEAKPANENQVGIDLGLHNFLTTSDGEKFDAVKPLRDLEDKVVRIQRRLSRMEKGSNNYNKQRLKLARLSEHIANIRKYQLDKLSTYLINRYGVICIETLKPSNMVKNHHLAKSICDASWSTFVNMLDYKAAWYGRKLIKIDQYYPSSQLCHNCGHKNVETKDLSVRSWICPQCGFEHDRDINAAINILNEGLKNK